MRLVLGADASLRQEANAQSFDCGGTLERDPPSRGAEHLNRKSRRTLSVLASAYYHRRLVRHWVGDIVPE